MKLTKTHLKIKQKESKHLNKNTLIKLNRLILADTSIKIRAYAKNTKILKICHQIKPRIS